MDLPLVGDGVVHEGEPGPAFGNACVAPASDSPGMAGPGVQEVAQNLVLVGQIPLEPSINRPLTKASWLAPYSPS